MPPASVSWTVIFQLLPGSLTAFGITTLNVLVSADYSGYHVRYLSTYVYYIIHGFNYKLYIVCRSD